MTAALPSTAAEPGQPLPAGDNGQQAAVTLDPAHVQALRAARLLELLAQSAAQASARAGAQDWINRTAAWAREDVDASPGLGLTLFSVAHGAPRWWVSADSAWAEKASAAVQEASELAGEALVDMAEASAPPGGWALPCFAEGEVVAVLVARADAPPTPDTLALLRASAAAAEPLLRQWRLAERSAPRRAWDDLRHAWRMLRQPGHLAFKSGLAAGVIVAGVLLLWPVSDNVTANVVIEGRVRHVVTAPFDGFVAQVLARPGEQVRRGQPLARLDDRDLKLEQQRFRSERDQAAGRQRQAMAERDPSALAQASAELRQAQAQLDLVEARLARAVLNAPIDGLVVSGDWVQQLGSPVETGKEMFEVASTDRYTVVLHVPDREIARVAEGQSGVLRLAGDPQQSHAFRLRRLTAMASVEEGLNGFRVEASWEGQVPALRPGMQGVGKIHVGEAAPIQVWTRPLADWLRLKLWAWWW